MAARRTHFLCDLIVWYGGWFVGQSILKINILLVSAFLFIGENSSVLSSEFKRLDTKPFNRRDLNAYKLHVYKYNQTIYILLSFEHTQTHTLRSSSSVYAILFLMLFVNLTYTDIVYYKTILLLYARTMIRSKGLKSNCYSSTNAAFENVIILL